MKLSDISLKTLVKEFTADGLVIGEDYSFGVDGKLMLSDAAVKSFLSRIPEDERAAFKAAYFEKTTQVFDLRTIAVNVGVHPDYFERLMKRVKTRFTKHVKADDGHYILSYSHSLIFGTCSKFPEINQDAFVRYFLDKVGKRNKQGIYRISTSFDKYPALPNEKLHLPGEDVWIDILEAASDDPGYGVNNGELYFSIGAIKTISQVWEDPSGERPMRELVASLDRRWYPRRSALRLNLFWSP